MIIPHSIQSPLNPVAEGKVKKKIFSILTVSDNGLCKDDGDASSFKRWEVRKQVHLDGDLPTASGGYGGQRLAVGSYAMEEDVEQRRWS